MHGELHEPKTDQAGTGLDFQLLGSLDVRRDGRSVPLTSAKHRILVAALLLRAGHVVSFADLAEAIWGDRQPENPRRVIQLYVTRLRKAFGLPGPEEVIATCPEGYRIDVRPEQVDLGRFRLGLRRADRAAEAGDLSGEAAALVRALGEWRGEPLAGLSSERLQREAVPALREQRIRSLERRLDLELRLGRGAAAIDELYLFTAQNPLRERLWMQLMTALDSCGRRTDALNAYHSARRHLADELGISPSRSLQLQYAEILAGDPVAAEAVAHPLPRQLPPIPPVFVGRTGPLARLDRWHADAGRQGATTVVISGTAGVGKTTLAAQWAHEVADDFPDGQLWASLRGTDPDGAEPAATVLTRFLRALGLPDEGIPADMEEKVGLFRSLTNGRRILIGLDDAADGEQVRPLLPSTPGCLTVVTSRNRLPDLVAYEGAHPLVLDLFTAEDARLLLARRLAADRIRASALAVADLSDACAGLPLALVTLAAHVASYPEVGREVLAADGAIGGVTTLPARRRSATDTRLPRGA